MATTFQYAYERIYEVLVDGSGTGRTLAAADRFNRGFPPGFAADLRATRAKEKPAVFAVITSGDRLLHGEMSDSHLYMVTVQIWRDHWLGYEGDPSEVEAQLVEASDRHFKLSAALCYGGTLKQTEAANATGFASEALLAGGFKLQRVNVLGDGGRDGRLLQYVDTFTGAFEFDPDG